MLLLMVFAIVLAPSQQQPVEELLLRSGSSQGALEYKTPKDYNFKGIPELAELASDEKREIYHYQQTIAVRDSGPDNKVRRCEIMEVYYEQEAQDVLRNLTSLLHVKVQEIDSMEKMMNIMNDCDSVDELKQPIVTERPKEWWAEGDSGEDKEPLGPNPLFNGIIPGTNWCGFGDIASNYHDLSGLHNVDRCCRAHDLCPIKVLAKDVRYNLENKAIYTKSHCMCDVAFYNCLKKDNGWSAKLIGNLYFYIASPQCVKGVPEQSESMQFVSAPKKW